MSAGTTGGAFDQALAALTAFVTASEDGARLPSERELARRFAVSRTTVRSAVARLQLLGFVEVRHGSGSYIRTPAAHTLALPFREVIAAAGPSAAELHELRLLLEPQLAWLAAKRVAIAGSQRLPAEGDCASFHEAVAKASGNGLAAELVRTVAALARVPDNVRAGSKAAVSAAAGPAQPGHDRAASVAQLMYGQHAAIAAAIGAGDAQAARSAMRTHLKSLARLTAGASG